MGNLLKDASILLTPTAYNNGSMLAVKPTNGDGDFTFSRNSAATRVNAQGLVENVQILSSNLVSNGDFSQEGSELVTNGNFATDSDWTLGTGWSIGDGKATSDGTQTSQSNLYQSGVVPINKTYKVTFSTVVTSGSLVLAIGGSNPQPTVTTSGTYTYTSKTTIGDSNLYFSASSDFIGSITNISVKEVGQDWTLGGGWSIGVGKVIGSSASGTLSQSGIAVAGKQYKVTIDITDYSSGTLYIDIGGSSAQTSTGNGLKTFYFTSTSIGSLRFFGGAFTGSITNISVIEITDDTNLPRINYEGFSYQDSLGSEEVVNGSFDVNGNWSNFGTPLVSEQSSTRYYTSPFSWYVKGDAFRKGISSPNNFTLTNGKTYNVSLWVYALDGAEILSGLNNTDKSVFTSHAVTQNEWTNITYSATANATSASYISILTSSSTLEFYVDNVSVKEDLGQEVVPNSGCGSWLLEPQSTNLFTYSEDFSQSVWAKNSVGSASAPVVTLNYATSPEGTQNASRLQLEVSGSSSSDKSFLENLLPLDGSSSYTLTFYIKSNNGVNQNLILLQNSVSGNAIIATNKWIRVEQSFSSNSTFNRGFGLMALGNIQQSVDVLIWGAQLEQNSYATSYTPTSGAISTRLRDIANNSGNASLINSEEGVLYGDIKFTSFTGVDYFGLNNGTNSERVLIERSGNSIRGYINSIQLISTLTSLENKIAIKWKLNDFQMYLNGVKVSEITSGSSPTGLDRLSFEIGGGLGLYFYGNTKALAVYKTALTDEQLTALTTI